MSGGMTGDETDTEWSTEACDSVRAAIGNLLVAIIESTNADSPERARAMNEALEAHGRIRDAMRSKPRLN